MGTVATIPLPLTWLPEALGSHSTGAHVGTNLRVLARVIRRL
jgi:hypothetical protein